MLAALSKKASGAPLAVDRDRIGNCSRISASTKSLSGVDFDNVGIVYD